MTLELRRTVEVDTTIQSGVGQAIVVGVLRAL